MKRETTGSRSTQLPRYCVRATRGTHVTSCVYAKGLSKRDAERMVETARLYKFHDAHIVKETA